MIQLSDACLFGAAMFALGLFAGGWAVLEMARDKIEDSYQKGLVDAFGIAGSAQCDKTRDKARDLMWKSISHMDHNLRRVK